MQIKFTLALSALALCLSVSALPLSETQDLVERDADFDLDLFDRSLADISDESLLARDVFDDPLDGLEARGKKKAPGTPPSPKTPPKKAAPPAGAKGAAMNSHVAAQRAAKNAAKNAQRGSAPGAKKTARTAEKKENRALAKKQKWQEGVKAGKYKMGLNGKPVHNNTPMTKADKAARATRKANGAAAHAASTPAQRAAKASKQAADRATHAAGKDARRGARVANKEAARTTAKTNRRTQMGQARADYKASIATGTFPGRATKFNTPQGKTYNGRDVRQALFNGHAAGQPGKGVGYESKNGKQLKPNQQHPKTFDNRPNSTGARPIPGMTGSGREFGMTHNKQKGYDGRSPNPTEARLITQPNGAGVHEFKGVVAHPAGPGDDHVQVHGTP